MSDAQVQQLKSDIAAVEIMQQRDSAVSEFTELRKRLPGADKQREAAFRQERAAVKQKIEAAAAHGISFTSTIGMSFDTMEVLKQAGFKLTALPHSEILISWM